MSNIVVYESGEIELKVSIDNDTLWLTQNEIATIFKKDRTVITRHINNILKDEEVDEKSNVQKMHFANSDKPTKLYGLDVVLAVGYRTNSSEAIKFRQWATSVLKEYITNGYVINSDKITNDRFVSLENEVVSLRNKFETISNGLESKILLPKQQIYFNGTYFDAHSFIINLIKSAKNSIALIDNNIDNTTLTMLSNNQEVNITLISHTFSKQLKQDIEKYNKQYKPLNTTTSKTYHDRYLIIDGDRVYCIGASLKDVGHKTFSVNLMSDFCGDDVLRRIE